jgi:hypothetical protein
MSVELIVTVDVVGPMIVIVHVHGNDAVIVIRPVDGGCATANKLTRLVAMQTKMIDP